jgi:hypothetical protein
VCVVVGVLVCLLHRLEHPSSFHHDHFQLRFSVSVHGCPYRASLAGLSSRRVMGCHLLVVQHVVHNRAAVLVDVDRAHPEMIPAAISTMYQPK